MRGIRGAGKSVWWGALQQPYFRDLLHELFPGLRHIRHIDVLPGFGEQAHPGHPDRDTLEALLKSFPPRLIWRTVLLWMFRDWKFEDVGLPTLTSWQERVGWLMANPEPVSMLFYRLDQHVAQCGQLVLVVFDALDRTAATWEDRGRLLEGLLQNLLEFSSYRAIRLKAFVRPDMLIGPEIGRFPDASKVLSQGVDLSWPRTDLYGLLWQYLANAAEGSDEFRDACQRNGLPFELHSPTTTWYAPEPLNRDESRQWRLMDALASRWMGNDKRRGYPYTWLPNHLADAHGSASPRSFLAALRQAAEESNSRYHDHAYALHYEAIKRGVQAASQIRVREMGEDFPWIDEVMAPLRDLIVPAELSTLAARWQGNGLDQRLASELLGVLPRRGGDFIPGLCEQLRAAGILEFGPDGRVNLPDVYRVGFGLRRLGGVKPVRSRE